MKRNNCIFQISTGLYSFREVGFFGRSGLYLISVVSDMILDIVFEGEKALAFLQNTRFSASGWINREPFFWSTKKS